MLVVNEGMEFGLCMYQWDRLRSSNLYRVASVTVADGISPYRRWVRLLFGREFPFEDVLCLWDVLFAEDATLGLVDLICVAMLLRIRWQRKFGEAP